MASGDLKSEDCIVIEVTYGASNTIGDLVHWESDGKWDKTASADAGKFGVALDTAADTELGRVCIWGPVEVTATAATISKGELVVADAGTVKTAGTISETTVAYTVVGTAMTDFASGGQGIVWIGMVD